MRKSSRGGRSPAGVATGESLTHARCQPFGADPRRIAHHEVEPAAVHHLGEVGLEREEGSHALLPQLAPREPQFPQALTQSRQPLPLIEVQPTTPAKEIAISRRAEQLGDGSFERGTAVVQKLSRQRCLGAAQLGLGGSLLRAG